MSASIGKKGVVTSYMLGNVRRNRKYHVEYVADTGYNGEDAKRSDNVVVVAEEHVEFVFSRFNLSRLSATTTRLVQSCASLLDLCEAAAYSR